MFIKSLHLSGFRNYQEWETELSPGLTVLVGANASGKTNALEAVQLVTTGVSFRNPRWEDLVRWGEEGAEIAASFSSEATSTQVQIRVTRDGRRSCLINGVAKRRVSDVAGILPTVLFTPDDLDLVKGPAEMRRSAIDDLGDQLSKTYGSIRRDYAKVVRHRNTLLREWRAGVEDLDPWNIQVASLGSKLLTHRRRLLLRVVHHAAAAYKDLADGEELSVLYNDHCGLGSIPLDVEVTIDEAERAIIETLKGRAADEIVRHVTLVGPHRDDIVFLLGGRNARTFASQGQQRTIALAWTLAKVAVVEDIARKKPILLLDDVMSELDEDRRRALTSLVQKDVQTIISTTNTGYFDTKLLKQAVVVEIPGK
ncbi:MAG: DNA replication/repair protein RecF [Actinomycetota bacterium]|nr:MAG: DNA replication and repair protein [Actinomycetota bacterium]MDO8949801.1 DNA replication/repair protein RecF [Actinomycetota bacterium]MDP3630531.1 DNA replication/repair protein RecF [Actinomycetota bacterium]